MNNKFKVKNFTNADEVTEIPNGRIEVIRLNDKYASKTTFKPGWKWSESVKPLAGTASCEFNHNLYIISGTMRVKMNDGSEFDCKAGDACFIPACHEAWVVGNENVVSIDFDDNMNYARKN